ncbi:MAG: hypothetical protein GY796_22355 [Chloroflexi bacterium]|nr:hypothetical protein [Chloroflexota bacterium]
MQTVTNNPSLKKAFRDSLIYSGVMGTFIIVTMMWNAEIWLNDYPPDIKEKYGEPSPCTKRLSLIIAVPFFAVMIGGPIWSNHGLKQANGGHLTFKAAFLNAYALIISAWLFDLTILDWLLFVKKTPDFVVLPGTEGMAGYDDYGFHLKEHLRASPMLAGFVLMIAALTASRP